MHPMSRHLASESGHMESESAEHDLHRFQAWRRMDEILVANYMVFTTSVREERYDLWIGDEAWEIDYYLHEHPRREARPYAWLTDFVGWLPMEEGGTHEALPHLRLQRRDGRAHRRAPEVRDRALFVGEPDDIVPDRLGPELPAIRDWTERHFDFAGYVTGFDPAEFRDREKLRPSSAIAVRACVHRHGRWVGGGGVSARKVIAAFPEAKERVPDLRMIVVAGPRIDPEGLPKAGRTPGLPVRARPLPAPAGCDLAVVQGGLTTAWSSRPTAAHSSTSRSRTTSSRTSMSTIASSATAPDCGWTSRQRAGGRGGRHRGRDRP